MTPSPLNTLFQQPELDQAKLLIQEYSFTLKGIPELIHLRLYQNLGDNHYEIEQSHYLQTPGMATPAFSDAGPFATAKEAMADALETFTQPYREATGRQLSPHQDWLLPNRDFH